MTPNRIHLEYQALRTSLDAYIRQRFDLTVVVVTATVALFGYGFVRQNGAIFLCSYVLLGLGVWHAWFVGYTVQRMGAYLRVFHEDDGHSGWETRLTRFRAIHPASMPHVGVLAHQLGYWGIALAASVCAAVYLSGWHRFAWPTAVFACFSLLNWVIYARITHRYRSGDGQVIATWHAVRDEEKKQLHSTQRGSGGSDEN
ncbi:MAG: hypothetical protein JSV79_07725 [Armatimonadota bacterium]|nr:MAG: hypothetical protein JSV79_07725 [Armatimonadota bacterium]